MSKLPRVGMCARHTFTYDSTNHELKRNGPEIKHVRMKTSNDLDHADGHVDEQAAACERGGTRGDQGCRDGKCH